MSNIKVEKQGNTALLTISNPPANVWTQDSLNELYDVIEQLDADPDNYALVITGEGDKFFSAGADLKTFASGDKGVAATMAFAFGRAFERLAAYKGVSIAAINGFAMGGGLECAMACDIRIAADNAQMALPEAAVGLLPCGCGTQNLPRIVGEGWAKRMILCGERLKADKALEIGLVEEVVGQGEAKDTALELAAKVAGQSPSSVGVCKDLIQAARTTAPDLNLPREREEFVALFDRADTTEGVNAFLEKRKPEWKNA
ncbi:MAG: enoyl-CoA hydratase [Salinisphaeraceae bacterium]|nr:enoyl-CoA hydratase [Salinisphaeraceae bacterium]